jgi:hypothetical protein
MSDPWSGLLWRFSLFDERSMGIYSSLEWNLRSLITNNERKLVHESRLKLDSWVIFSLILS